MIKVTELGPNSCAINVVTETSNVALMDAMTTWLLNHGWELHDNWTTTKRVFKSLNVDGTTYKYVLVDMQSIATVIYFYIAEAWNATTHTGTNVNVAQSYNTATISYNCTIYLFATSKYIVTFSKISNVFSNAIIVAEHIKDNTVPKVTAYPSYIVTSSDGLSATSGGIGWTRTSLGTGATANASYAYFSNTMSRISPLTGGNNSSIDSGFSTAQAAMNAFATPDLYATFTDTRAEHRGRLFGIKCGVANFGTMLDRISLKCDANGFTDNNGVDVEHYIIVPATLTSHRIAIPT